jgi:hypothetical protein
MPTKADKLANEMNEMLEKAVQWLDGANGAVDHWKNVQSETEKVAKGASGINDAEERKLWEYKADVGSRMTGVGLTATRQIQRAAAEELTRIQEEFFVEDVKVDAPDKVTGVAIGRVITKRPIPKNYRFWWKAGSAEVRPKDPATSSTGTGTGTSSTGTGTGTGTSSTGNQWTSVEIDANELPFGDTTVEVLIGKVGKDDVNPWLHI